MLTKAQKVLLFAAACFYAGAGALHFGKPAMYEKIVPPYLPFHRAIVYLSGAAELAGGIALLIPILRRPAAWGLVALLVAVFPANIYMATNPVEAGAASIAPAVLWGRLLLQPVFIYWVLWCTRESKAR